MRSPVCRLALIVAVSCLAVGRAWSHSATVDGTASEWIGTPGSQVHSTVESAGEWIYKGESGDSRTDPSGDDNNYDLTEVRITTDATDLYLLVRFADITNFNETSVCLGIDNDGSGGDTSLDFSADESGLTYGGVGSLMPEYIAQIHNAQAVSPITQVEIYDDNDGNGTVWYAPGSWDAYISEPNNLLEARISLSALGLTSTSTFRFSLATFDNGTNGDPSAIAFNNVDDTTVDYLFCDALDCVGGTVGTSANAFSRDLGDGTLNSASLITLPISSGVGEWNLLDD